MSGEANFYDDKECSQYDDQHSRADYCRDAQIAPSAASSFEPCRPERYRCRSRSECHIAVEPHQRGPCSRSKNDTSDYRVGASVSRNGVFRSLGDLRILNNRG